MTTKKALKKSIANWEKNVKDATNGAILKLGPSQCPLCCKFLTLDAKCIGCPVYEKTGQIFCKGTPYIEAHFYNTFDTNTRGQDLIRECEKEVEFLKSLLVQQTILKCIKKMWHKLLEIHLP
jgi:hypothetical protein